MNQKINKVDFNVFKQECILDLVQNVAQQFYASLVKKM